MQDRIGMALETARQAAERAAKETGRAVSLREIVFARLDVVEEIRTSISRTHPRDVWNRTAEAIGQALKSQGIDLEVNPSSLKTYVMQARAIQARQDVGS